MGVGLQTPSYKARTQQNTIIQKKAAGESYNQSHSK